MMRRENWVPIGLGQLIKATASEARGQTRCSSNPAWYKRDSIPVTSGTPVDRHAAGVESLARHLSWMAFIRYRVRPVIPSFVRGISGVFPNLPTGGG